MKNLLDKETNEEINCIKAALRMCDIDVNLGATYKVVSIIREVEKIGVDKFGVREAIALNKKIDADLDEYDKSKLTNQ